MHHDTKCRNEYSRVWVRSTLCGHGQWKKNAKLIEFKILNLTEARPLTAAPTQSWAAEGVQAWPTTENRRKRGIQSPELRVQCQDMKTTAGQQGYASSEQSVSRKSAVILCIIIIDRGRKNKIGLIRKCLSDGGELPSTKQDLNNLLF